MLYKEILTQALSSTILKDENLQAIAAQLIHDTCCQAVLEIQAILADDTRTDKDCFYQIEKIVCASLRALREAISVFFSCVTSCATKRACSTTPSFHETGRCENELSV